MMRLLRQVPRVFFWTNASLVVGTMMVCLMMEALPITESWSPWTETTSPTITTPTTRTKINIKQYQWTTTRKRIRTETGLPRVISRSHHLSALYATGRRSCKDENNNHNTNNNNLDNAQNERESSKSRPTSVDMYLATQTRFQGQRLALGPSQPKIVVLGASGKVGRWVVRQLLEMPSSSSMTIVAFVRDYDKAIQVFYDDLVFAQANRFNNDNNKKNNGPQLQIVTGDLIPDELLPICNGGGTTSTNDDLENKANNEKPGRDPKQPPKEHTEDDAMFWKRAESAARYFGNRPEDYNDNDDYYYKNNNNIHEALEEAIQDCTAIISCVGSVRKTHLWTDVLARPLWRWLRPDVSHWCQDRRHPFYVHYATTRQVLALAEKEQWKREFAATAATEAKQGGGLDDAPVDTKGNDNKDDTDEDVVVPRIRFIRISDLCVGQKPWHLVPLVTNMIHSVVFRYHEMAEQLMEQSTLIETISLRPGDLVDEERDITTTGFQVSHTGTVPLPARVGREDVASLAVAAAMFQTPEWWNSSPTMGRRRRRRGNVGSGNGSHKSKAQVAHDHPAAFHLTLACRWVGQNLDPYPAQGVKADGAVDASTALQRTLKLLEKNERRRRQLQQEQEGQRGWRRLGRGKSKVRLPDQDLNDSTPLLALSTSTSSSSSSDDMWWWQMSQQLERKRIRTQPHGLCAAIPLYLSLAWVAKTLLHTLLQSLPGGKTWMIPALQRLSQFLWMGLWGLGIKILTILQSLLLLSQQKRYITF